MPYSERRPERATRIARRRLNPDPVEKLFAKNHAVSDAIERHATREAKVPLSSNLPRVSGQAKHDFFGHRLDGAGDVHVARLNGAIGQTGRTAQKAMEPLVGHADAAQ